MIRILWILRRTVVKIIMPGNNGGDMTVQQLFEWLQKSQNEQTEKLTSEIAKSLEDNKKQNKKNEKHIGRLYQNYLSLERKKRKNNIIIFGLVTETEHILNNTIDKVNSLLNVNIKKTDINNIYTIGKNPQKRGILIEFISFLTK